MVKIGDIGTYVPHAEHVHLADHRELAAIVGAVHRDSNEITVDVLVLVPHRVPEWHTVPVSMDAKAASIFRPAAPDRPWYLGNHRIDPTDSQGEQRSPQAGFASMTSHANDPHAPPHGDQPAASKGDAAGASGEGARGGDTANDLDD
jgi:hypothetical protein